MNMPELQAIVDFVDLHQATAYALLFLVMVWEGETFLIIAGILLQLGALALGPALAVAFGGVMLGDVLWYSLGRLAGKRPLPRPLAFARSTAERIVERISPNFRTKPILSLSIAKFVYGTNHATLVIAGTTQMPFRLFVAADLAASFLWVIVFLALGYLFGYAAIAVSQRVGVLLLVLLLLIVGFMAVQRFLSYYYEHKRNDF